MSPIAPGWLLLLLTLAPLIAQDNQAAIHHELPSSRSDSDHSEDGIARTGEPQIGDARSITTKFIILTTGSQIKLYPLESDEKQPGGGDLVPTYDHYLLQTAAQDKSTDDSEPTMKLGNNPFSQLLFGQSAGGQAVDRDQPEGYLRQRRSRHEGNYFYSAESRSADNLKPDKSIKEPWIVDVDYFFDPRFCYPSFASSYDVITRPEGCLVVVWLDKSNKLLRYGSINLAANPIKTLRSSSSSSRKNRVLSVREFAPISIVADLPESQYDSQVSGMVVDRRRSRIYVAYSDGSAPYANRILSGKLRSSPSYASSGTRLLQETTFAFNQCSTNASKIVDTSFENMSVDEENGDWLFYFDRYKGGKIFALNVNPLWKSDLKFEEESAGGSKPFISSSLQALVRDIPSSAWQENPSSDNAINATGMAIDPTRHQLIWLNEANEIRSCDYAGSHARLVGKLSPKPVIKSPHTMQVFQDSLYISDPIKKTLIAYKLVERSSSGVMHRDKTKCRDDPAEKRDCSSDMIVQSTHQVLLVEMPTIYGFRIVDLLQPAASLHGKGLEVNIEKVHSDIDLMRDQNEVEPSPDNEQSYLEFRDSLYFDLEKTDSHYSQLLLDRSYSSLQCGYDQTSDDMSTLLFLLISLTLFNLTFFALSIMLPRLKGMVVKVKEDRLGVLDGLNANTTSKCPV